MSIIGIIIWGDLEEEKLCFLDNHLKGTSQSQKMMRFVIGG